MYEECPGAAIQVLALHSQGVSLGLSPVPQTVVVLMIFRRQGGSEKRVRRAAMLQQSGSGAGETCYMALKHRDGVQLEVGRRLHKVNELEIPDVLFQRV